MSYIQLPYEFGKLSTKSVPDFLSDLFLSSAGTPILTVFMLTLLILWRCLIDNDSEEHYEFVEMLKEQELKKKWDAHNEKWGTDHAPPKREELEATALPDTRTTVIQTAPFPTKVSIVGDLKTANTVLLTYHGNEANFTSSS